MIIQLPTRVQGATLPDTPVYWQEDGVYLDLSAYTLWQIEARAIGATGALLWTKTTGFTAAAGSAEVPSLLISWLAGDLGALVGPGQYDLELTGTFGGKPRKQTLRISITAELA